MNKEQRVNAYNQIFGAAVEAAAKQAGKGTMKCPNSGATIYVTQQKRLSKKGKKK